jgi:hypothetical protein
MTAIKVAPHADCGGRRGSIYVPPEHADGTVRATKSAAELSEEHFDGKTTE